MVKRTITITTVLLILSMIVSLIIILNKSSFAADDDIASGTSGTCSWVIDSEGVLTISPTDGVSGTLDSYSLDTNNEIPWKSNRASITKVFVEPGVKTGNACRCLFYLLSNCTEMDLRYLDTSDCTNMSWMFNGCSKIETINMSGFDTSNVTDVSFMFYNCQKITSLPDIANWNTSNFTTINQVFFGCKNIEYINVSNWDTSNITDFLGAFQGCDKLISVDLSNWNTSKATTLSSLFDGCKQLSSIGNISVWDTSKVTGMSSTFRFCKELVSLDLSNWDVSKVTSFYMMFQNCTKLETIGNITSWNTSNVTHMGRMFMNCSSLKTVDLSNFNVSKVTTMEEMFDAASKLTSIGDISNWKPLKLTTTHNMFADCSKLSSIDLSGWETPLLTSINSMFGHCGDLTSLDVSGLDTSKVTDMRYAFENCKNLQSLDLSNWDTSSASIMERMFNYCKSLRNIKIGESFNFLGRGIENESERAILPTPPTDITTGKWIRVDKAFGPYTSAELRDNYNGSTMLGEWVWENKKYTVTYSYENIIPQNASVLPTQELHEAGDEVTVAQDAAAPGYTFSGWSRTGTFEMPAEDVMITGSFTANTNTTYKVEHYLEDLNGSTYTLTKTDNLTGATNSEVMATANDYEGFTFDDSIYGTKLSGNISADGSLVLKVYYKRNSYNVTYSYTGEIPNNASALPSMTSFRYEEEIVVADDASAEGYTFSGWIKDYINMPAQDIEITGYFIEVSKSYRYKVEYFFDGEVDDSLEEIMNAKKDEEISINPQSPLKHGEKNYTLVSNNHNITISINDEDNIINVYYESDVLDYEFKYPEGDGIPDKYQIKIIFKVENGSWNDGTNKDKVDVITLYDKDGNPSENGTGSTKIPEVGSKPNQGYTYGYWNRNIPSKVTNTDDGKEYVYSYEIVKTIEADIAEGKGKSPNPKTYDVMNRYLLAGVGGILVLTLVSRIRRRYSKKAKKIQF